MWSATSDFDRFVIVENRMIIINHSIGNKVKHNLLYGCYVGD